MNISIKQYAKTLYRITDGKSKSEVEKTMEEFVAVLAENNDQGKIKKIIAEFNNLWNKEKGIIEAEVVSANELDSDIVKLLNNYIIKLSGAKEVVLSEKVDKKVLAGVVIKYGDKILDGSLKTKINELKEGMIK